MYVANIFKKTFFLNVALMNNLLRLIEMCENHSDNFNQALTQEDRLDCGKRITKQFEEEQDRFQREIKETISIKPEIHWNALLQILGPKLI